jgi:phosphoglycolate phosphatase
MPIPADAELRKYVGPPLRECFASLLRTSDEKMIERVISSYRERFTSVGMYENTLYRDTLDTLQRLRTAGYRLFVATSKPTDYATRIVEHFGIDRYITRVYGSELSGERSDKAELLKHLLAAERIVPGDAVMVGDRHHDVLGARANRVVSIGVLWGYGDREELHQADYLVDTWPGLFECIRGLPFVP